VTLAIFDLDNTLIAGDSDHSWGQFLAQKQLVDADDYRKANDQFYADYKNGILDIVKYLNFSLSPLPRYSPHEWQILHQEFMRDYIEPMLLAKAMELIQFHRRQDHTLLIITATNGFVTRPIAKRLGIDNILATDPEIVNGNYTGKFTGIPCFQTGKITHLHDWLKKTEHSLEGAFFYSDSINDLPLLEQVDNPVAVDADERLTAIATARGWKRMSLR
jgi:HAD superfamily hydrolase (TIGR01490 family)